MKKLKELLNRKFGGGWREQLTPTSVIAEEFDGEGHIITVDHSDGGYNVEWERGRYEQRFSDIYRRADVVRTIKAMEKAAEAFAKAMEEGA